MGVFKRYKDRSFWRKISMATWTHPRDPQVYGALDIDARAMLRVMDEARAADVRVTPTHFVGKGIGEAVPLYPALNGIIVRGKLRLRETVDVWFNVAFDEGDLFGAKVERCEEKSVAAIADELAAGAERIRAKKKEIKDKRLKNYNRLTGAVPVWLLRPLLWLVDRLNFSVGLNLTWLGVERDPFGTAMVTNIGTFDMVHAFAPIPPLMRMPVVLVVGRIHDKPVAEGGEVVVRPTLPLSITIDHRYLDGFQAARLAKVFQDYLESEDRLRSSLGLDRLAEAAPA